MCCTSKTRPIAILVVGLWSLVVPYNQCPGCSITPLLAHTRCCTQAYGCATVLPTSGLYGSPIARWFGGRLIAPDGAMVAAAYHSSGLPVMRIIRWDGRTVGRRYKAAHWPYPTYRPAIVVQPAKKLRGQRHHNLQPRFIISITSVRKLRWKPTPPFM